MKFLIFNIVVVAALGYILYERGDIDSAVIEDLAAKAEAIVAEAGGDKPMAVGAEDAAAAEGARSSLSSEPQPSRANALPALPLSDPAPGPMPVSSSEPTGAVPVEPQLAPPAAQEAAEVEIASVDTESIARDEIAPAAIAEPVAPEIAARRAVILDLAANGGSEGERPAMKASERQENLRALSEEMEFLSLDMIYR